MHFAEFLDASSSVRLCFLSSPTCVGLWYGPPQHILRGYFPARRLHALHPPVRGLPHGSAQRRDLPLRLSASPLCRGLPTPRRASPYASPHRSCGRRGNVDPLPIAYGFRPRLRGRLTPGQIAFTLETSGFRRRGIPPLFALLIPAFSLPSRPPGLPPRLLPYMECSPTHMPYGSAGASVPRLAPLNCRRPTTRPVSCYATRPVSCYALFEGVAASEPTSWLSVQSDFLSHLARLWDLSCRSGLFPSRPRPLSAAA